MVLTYSVWLHPYRSTQSGKLRNKIILQTKFLIVIVFCQAKGRKQAKKEKKIDFRIFVDY